MRHLLRFLLPLWLLSTVLMSGLIAGCQPPDADNTALTSSDTNNKNTQLSPIIINDDSVTMAPEYILSIKPTRYQPSLGLQGKVEPTHHVTLTAAHDLKIHKMLVTNGQWVEKGMPLLIVQRHINDDPNMVQHNDNISVTQTNSAKNNVANNANNTVAVTPTMDSPATGNEDGAVDMNSRINNNTDSSIKSAENTIIPTSMVAQDTEQLTTIRASFSGRIDSLYIENAPYVKAGEPLLQLNDDTDLQFIATLPIQAESQLSIGQNVNFTATGISDIFTGQVSKLTINRQSKQLLVNVHVVKNDISRKKLRPKMAVTGRVDYGQIEVGTIVPKQGLHDVDLTELQKPPYQPLSPLTANVWIVRQDQRLTRQSVEVIHYDPSTEQYLIAGISNDSLICLADLPLKSAGKKVEVS